MESLAALARLPPSTFDPSALLSLSLDLPLPLPTWLPVSLAAALARECPAVPLAHVASSPTVILSAVESLAALACVPPASLAVPLDLPLPLPTWLPVSFAATLAAGLPAAPPAGVAALPSSTAFATRGLLGSGAARGGAGVFTVDAGAGALVLGGVCPAAGGLPLSLAALLAAALAIASALAAESTDGLLALLAGGVAGAARALSGVSAIVGDLPLVAPVIRLMASCCLACSSVFMRCNCTISYSSCAVSLWCRASTLAISACRNFSVGSVCGCTSSLPRGMRAPTRAILSWSMLSLMKPSATALLMMSSWLSPHSMMQSTTSGAPWLRRNLYSLVSMSRNVVGSVLRECIFVFGCDLVVK